MIDLAVPADTLSLFNFRQYVLKSGKETFRYIFFDNFEYISKLHDFGCCVMLLLIISKILFYVLPFTWVMIFMNAPTAILKLLLPISVRLNSALNAVLMPHKLILKYLYNDNIVFGAVATLHTFGRSLQWNPHLLILVCKDGYDKKNNKIKSFAFMSYKKLRHIWR